MKPPESILIVCIRLIGDVILTTPLIGLLKEAYPEAAIDILVGKGTGEFLEKDPRVRRVLYSEKGGKGYFREIFRRYDLAINMNASDRGNSAVLFAGRRQRVGFYLGRSFWKDVWKRLFFTHSLEFQENIPVARYCELVADALSIPGKRLQVKVFWDATDESKVSAILKGHNCATPFFVVHPFARWIYKYWKFDRFAAVSDAIAERYGLQPVWTSSPAAEEKRLLNEAADLCRTRPVLIAGELTLNQMTCLISRAAFYLGLDTAVTHLAASTGIPMVALYGPTFTSRWFPWHNDGDPAQGSPETRGVLQRGNIVVLQKDLECVPCGKAGCDDGGDAESPCLAAIGVDEVLMAVGLLLKDEAVARSVIEEKMKHV
ncbi:glycosyltransferase family 9 protein [Geoanaerobacter pelophilus]|uniref:glycosyltransferase family 9 protein n=1 Tax=Geoanaerobacter pelophilus TaxID=60036 RepID=UPI00307FABBA